MWVGGWGGAASAVKGEYPSVGHKGYIGCQGSAIQWVLYTVSMAVKGEHPLWVQGTALKVKDQNSCGS